MRLIEAMEAVTQAREVLTKVKEEVLDEQHEEDRKLAEALHSRECRLSHEDQCGWHWDEERAKGKMHEVWKKNRAQWLLRARALRDSGITVESLEMQDRITRLTKTII